jgi:hypothetical protein
MTQIFYNHEAFLNREDKSINGVNQLFVRDNPNWEQDDRCTGCWNCIHCINCTNCDDCSNCVNCIECTSCFDSSYCVGCNSSNDIQDCVGCAQCTCVVGFSYTVYNKPIPENVPVIENIHQKVYEAVINPENRLEMLDWHTCDSQHCRAGWVVHLAGTAGYELERKTNTLFAAMHIKRCAELERKNIYLTNK